jgi:hypothetical protein
LSLQRHRNAALRWLLPLTSIYLYTFLFRSFRIPVLLSGDQMFFWTHAHRMLNGERPYIDFFQFTPPGTDLVFAGLFRMFGERVLVTNAIVLVLGVVLATICFLVARRVVEPKWAALATALFVVPFYGELLNATHHWFSTLLVMTAVLVLCDGTSPGRLIVAGALLGVASFFTQTRGAFALVAVAVWLLLECREGKFRVTAIANVIASFAATLLTLELPFLVHAGVARMWFEQVTYVQRHVVKHVLGLPPLNSYNLFQFAQYLLPYLLLPLIYPAVLLRSKGDPKVRLLAIVGLASLIEVALSPNYLRLYSVAMPGIILLTWWAAQSRTRGRILCPAICIFVIAALVQQTMRSVRTEYVVLELPAGRAAVNRVGAEKLAWMRDHALPGDWVYQPAFPSVYFPMQVRNPAFLDELTPNFMTTEPDYIDRSIRQLSERPTRYVLWSPRLDVAADPDQLVELRRFLRVRYRMTSVFRDGEEVWELKQ